MRAKSIKKRERQVRMLDNQVRCAVERKQEKKNLIQ